MNKYIADIIDFIRVNRRVRLTARVRWDYQDGYRIEVETMRGSIERLTTEDDHGPDGFSIQTRNHSNPHYRNAELLVAYDDVLELTEES